MGPEPMTRTFRMSARGMQQFLSPDGTQPGRLPAPVAPFSHRSDELPEEIGRVAGARRRFGMVLHGKDGELRVAESFVRAVVQVYVRLLEPVTAARQVNDEAVILAGDLDAPRLQSAHGMIGAVMPEAQ